MSVVLRAGSVLTVVAAAAALAACGGGGGGGSVGPPAGITPGPLATPTFAPAAGITLLAPAAGNVLVAGVPGTAADELVLAQVATTPGEPGTGGSLAQYAATVNETAGVSASSAAREAASVRSAQLRARIVENRRSAQAERLRERAIPVDMLRAAMRGITVIRAGGAQSGRMTRAAAGTVGQQRTFKILTSKIGNSGGCAGGSTANRYICNTTITATLKAVGAHGNIWVDNASLATPGEFTVAGEFGQIAAKFDQYYATEIAAFAPAFYPGTPAVTFATGGKQCDVNGNDIGSANYVRTDISGSNGTSIDVVITDALAGTGEGGYYFGGDEIPQEVWNCDSSANRLVSNNTAMFVIGGNNYPPAPPQLLQFNETYWLNTDAPRGMSHELQHLLHDRWKVVKPEVTSATATFDDAFLNEGMSMLAEDLATDPAPGRHIDTPRYTFVFLLEPSLFSLTAFAGYQPDPASTATNPPYGWFTNTAGSYGQAYLFQRYLYDRFGPAYIASVYNSTASSVAAVSAAANEPFPQLDREFALAVSAQNTSVAAAPYAFSSAVVLRGNVDVPSRRVAPLDVRHYVFSGPQPPELFANNQPTGFLALSPGSSGSTFVIDGATLFLPAANEPAGSTVRVTAPTAPAYQGGLLQGTLPTPPPSST